MVIVYSEEILMNKRKRETVLVNARLETSLNERINAFCEKYGVSKTHVIENAIITYLDKQEEIFRIAAKLTD